LQEQEKSEAHWWSRLPKELVETEKIKEGEIIEFKGQETAQESFGILKGVGPFTAKTSLKTHE